MSRPVRALPAVLLVLGAVFPATVVPATAGPAEAAGAGWVEVGSPHVAGSNERPQAVVSAAANDVWAIGYRYTSVGGAAEFRALAEHWTGGSSFELTETPDRETAPARDFLYGAAAPAPDDVWAVGTSIGVGRPTTTLIEHWNGSRWSIVDSPDPGARDSELQAAAATSPTDVWAVGARINSDAFYQAPMILHWNGAAWSDVAVPRVPGCTGHSYLTAVTALNPRAAWTTGWCGSGGSSAERGYVMRWNGRAWSLATVIAQGVAPQSETYGISATSNRNVWVVGQDDDGALTYHWDGSTWSVVPTPGGAQTLAGVTQGSRGLWAVGSGSSPQPPFAGPAALAHPTNAGWVDVRPAAPFGSLTAVTTTSDRDLWAVGSQILSGSGDDTALLLHRPAPTG